jgi:hypothetical protein
VLFDFLLDFADFGCKGLERVLEVCVLGLEVWVVSGRWAGERGSSYLAVSLLRLVGRPPCCLVFVLDVQISWWGASHVKVDREVEVGEI